jgi:3-carboxy-cis,cis-muconate cycloisomerase
MTSSLLFGPLFEAPEIAEIFSDQGHLQGMLDFETALARAEHRVGIVPETALAPIAAAAEAGKFDLAALGAGAASAGNTAIPMVKALTALVAATDPEAARWVHWGATSQDAMDTGLVLQLQAALPLLEADLRRLAQALATLAETHIATPMVGRTWLQHAVPITFGLKAANWLASVLDARDRLAEAGRRALQLQFGGAAGTLASLGAQGLAVAEALAEELSLALPDSPWHSRRERLVDLGAALALLTGTLGKLARDLSLLMQTDVGEAFEPAGAGKGGSSTMPHKRNPVGAAVALSAASRMPGLVASLFAAQAQEHERGLGGWHAEWETLPLMLRLASGSLHHMTEAMSGLEVDPTRMAENLGRTNGLILAEAASMALGATLGREAAHRLVERASKRAVAEEMTLHAVLAADPDVSAALDAESLARALRPDHYLGMAEAFTRRVLARHQASTPD